MILLAEELGASKVAAAVAGGETRAASVQRGARGGARGRGVVLVHDAAGRSCWTRWSSACSRRSPRGGTASCRRFRLPDTVKRVRGGGGGRDARARRAWSRRRRRRPFVAETLRRAFARRTSADATDCASLVEARGGRVQVVDGDPRLLKVTTPADLELVESWLVRAVFFDVGETLLDETRLWESWADSLGIPRFTCPRDARRRDRARRGPPAGVRAPAAGPHGTSEPAAGDGVAVRAGRPVPGRAAVLRELRSRGYRLGAAATTTTEVEDALRRCGFEFDAVGSSEGWRSEAVAALLRARRRGAGASRSEVAYVGDRVDNDVVPAATAGLVPIFIRRGPVGGAARRAPEATVARAHRLAGRAAGGCCVASEYRVGTGFDAHALEPGVPLVLGGSRSGSARPRRPLRRRRHRPRAHRRAPRRRRPRRHRDAVPSDDPELRRVSSLKLLARRTARCAERGGRS